MEKKADRIVHLDMDAFFTSIEQRDEPSFKGKPVIVGADPEEGRGRGVVAASSYEARKYGIHSAMPISIAYKKCPHAVFLPPDMGKYAKESQKIFSILLDFTPAVEPISIDEAFADITGSWHLWESPEKTCIQIKKTVKQKSGLTASLGMAPVKMAAKIASDMKKPDGLVIVEEEELTKFLHPLPAEKLWGVGKRTLGVLKANGLNLIGDIAHEDPSKLETLLGKNGLSLWTLANGVDERKVILSNSIKSIGHEHTFRNDTCNRSELLDALMSLSEDISRRIRKKGLAARTITLKLRLNSFETFTRSVTMPNPIYHVDEIYKAAVDKFDSFNLKEGKIRLIGIRATKLQPRQRTPDLFGESEKDPKREALQNAVDALVDKYGKNAIRRRHI